MSFFYSFYIWLSSSLYNLDLTLRWAKTRTLYLILFQWINCVVIRKKIVMQLQNQFVGKLGERKKLVAMPIRDFFLGQRNMLLDPSSLCHMLGKGTKPFSSLPGWYKKRSQFSFYFLQNFTNEKNFAKTSGVGPGAWTSIYSTSNLMQDFSSPLVFFNTQVWKESLYFIIQA